MSGKALATRAQIEAAIVAKIGERPVLPEHLRSNANLAAFQVGVGYRFMMADGTWYETQAPGPRAGQWWCKRDGAASDEAEQLIDLSAEKKRLVEVRNEHGATLMHKDDADSINAFLRWGAQYERALAEAAKVYQITDDHDGDDER